MSPRSRTLLAVGALAWASACVDDGSDSPLAKPVYPTGLALSPGGDHLVVVSSNFDLAFDTGALLSADVAALRGDLVGPDVVVKEPYDADTTVPLPSFGDRPVFAPDGSAVLIVTRGDNRLHEIDFDDGALTCVDDACGESPGSVQLGVNDPFHVNFVTTGAADGDLRGLVTHLSAPQAEFFHLRPGSDGADRLGVERDELNFGESIEGVRASAVRNAGAENDEQVFVALQRLLDGVVDGVTLGAFAVPGVDRGDDITVDGLDSVDVTAETGALFARSLVVVDVDGGAAVIVALRAPDAIARFFYSDRTGTFSLTHVSETCGEPTNLAVVDATAATGNVARVLVTCQGGEVVQALDPNTLLVSDSARFYGRNPHSVAVDADNGFAYVSYFLDDSVGVFRLADDDGLPRLSPVGRLGTPLPLREDGRE